MNEREAYNLLAERLGVTPDMVPYTADLFIDHTIINPVKPESLKKLGPVLDLRPGKRILDLACGKAGVSLPLVHTYQVKLTGVDLMPDFIREAWSRAEFSGQYPLCSFRMADVTEFVANATSQWDAVLILGALSHLWNGLAEGIEKVRALVNPGGFLVVGEGYRKPGGEEDPNNPFMPKEETEAAILRAGKSVLVIDDGPDGWDSYIEPQKKHIALLKEKKADNQEVIEFLDSWSSQMEWEKENLGYAVWVVQVS